jgi:hypothetical protein
MPDGLWPEELSEALAVVIESPLAPGREVIIYKPNFDNAERSPAQAVTGSFPVEIYQMDEVDATRSTRLVRVPLRQLQALLFRIKDHERASDRRPKRAASSVAGSSAAPEEGANPRLHAPAFPRDARAVVRNGARHVAGMPSND